MAELKHKYIFPDFLAKGMAKVDQRTQYEASMMSMTLISVGMVVTVIYFILYFDLKVWYKVILIINGVAGVIFMSSYLITTFQQYTSYMEALDFQNEMLDVTEKTVKGGNENA